MAKTSGICINVSDIFSELSFKLFYQIWKSLFIMFALFGSLSNSLAMLHSIKPLDPNALFNFKYETRKHDFYNITSEGRGFYAGFRIHGNDVTSLTYSINQSANPSLHQGISVKYSEFIENTQYIRAQFDITNNNFYPRQIDLGVFCDVDVAGDDKAFVQEIPGMKGLEMANKAKMIYYTVFTDIADKYPAVDHIYVGDLSNESSTTFSKMPFFMNSSEDSAYGDTVYSFSWINRTVYPNQTLTLGALFHPYFNFALPPVLLNENSEQIFTTKGQTVNLKFKTHDTENYDKIIVTLNTSSGVSMNQTLNADPSKFSDVTFSLNADQEPVMTYTAYAENRYAKYSEHSTYQTGKIFVYAQPQCNVDQEPLKSYDTSDKISVHVTAPSAQNSKIYYFFDDGRLYASDTGDLNIDIPPQVLPGRKHTLTFFVEDENGARSPMSKKYEFDLTGKEKEGATKENVISAAEEAKINGKGKDNTAIIVSVVVVVVVVIAAVAVGVFFYLKKKKSSA